MQDGSLIDLLGLETLLGGGEEGVQEVETTEQTIAVKTAASSSLSDVCTSFISIVKAKLFWKIFLSGGEFTEKENV